MMHIAIKPECVGWFGTRSTHTPAHTCYPCSFGVARAQTPVTAQVKILAQGLALQNLKGAA
jgi:hypothetical protein